jgi:hypothetical protein
MHVAFAVCSLSLAFFFTYFRPWRWRQNVPSKHRWTSTVLQDVTSRKFTEVRAYFHFLQTPPGTEPMLFPPHQVNTRYARRVCSVLLIPCIFLRIFDPEDGGRTFLRNTGERLPYFGSDLSSHLCKIRSKKWCSCLFCDCSGFSVSVCGRHHIFKPVSVQAMW